MITKSDASLILNDSQMSRVRDVNRKVGKVKLYTIESLLKQIANSQGRILNIPSNGYRSMYTPEMLDVPVSKFLQPKTFTPKRSDLDVAVKNVRSKLRKMGTVVPLSLSESMGRLMHDKADHFAGLPTMGKKSDDPEALARAMQCAGGKCPPPVVIGHRGKNTEVARAVWMFPFEWHILEGAYFFPLQDRFMRKNVTYASDNAVDRRARFNSIVSDDSWGSKLLMDYSGFDASIGTQLIGISFSLMKEHLKLDAKQEKNFDRVATYFATCQFIDQHGMLVSGRRGGVPSGSMFTQMVDSIVNMIVIEYALMGVEKRYFVYGDDSWTVTTLSTDELENRLPEIKHRASALGVVVNLKKTEVIHPRILGLFLGHRDLCKGRPLDEVIARLIYPERPFDAGDATLLKQRIIAYMAESDESMGLLIPLLNLINAMSRNPGSIMDVDSFTDSGPQMVTHATMEGNINPRYATGLAQFILSEDSSLASSFFKIRAAV